MNEVAAALGDGGIEIVDGLEVRVGEWFIDERPEMVGGLPLRGVGRLVDQPDSVGNWQVLRRMPAGIVELENDAAIASGPDLAKKPLLMPLDMNQTVSPLVGATKPVT
jgi:hypothetical protein